VPFFIQTACIAHRVLQGGSRRGAKGTEIEMPWGRGGWCPLPIRLGDLGELWAPLGGPGQSPTRKRIWCILFVIEPFWWKKNAVFIDNYSNPNDPKNQLKIKIHKLSIITVYEILILAWVLWTDLSKKCKLSEFLMALGCIGPALNRLGSDSSRRGRTLKQGGWNPLSPHLITHLR